MKCLIVDDEPLARQVMEKFAGMVPFLEVAALCSSASEAADFLQKSKTDLVFLDIQMPRVTGLDFINSLKNPPLVILVTAYSEYALQGFHVNALDYLVKPVPFDRFLKAANKAHELFQLRLAAVSANNAEKPESFLVKSGYKTLRIEYSKILFVEGLKDYVKISLEDSRPVLTLMTMKKLEENLPPGMFLRIHKSYIIAVNRIRSISKGRVMIAERWIPVGDSYREIFRKTVLQG